MKVIVIDFETTGLYPGADRVIEAAAVVVEDGEITRTFQRLANPGVRIPSFIEGFTGITNAMVAKAPPTSEVVAELADFLGDAQLAAHNANFDRGFLTAELKPLRRTVRQDFLCTLLLSRRIARGLPSYKLEQVARHLDVQVPKETHRALADAEMAARVLVALVDRLKTRLRVPSVSAEQLLKAQSIAPKNFDEKAMTLVPRQANAAVTPPPAAPARPKHRS